MRVVSLCSAASASATLENQNCNEIEVNDIVGFVVCSICRVAFKYDAKTTGCSHLGRHVNACKPQVKKQMLMTSLVEQKVKLSDREKLDIKNAQLQYCVRGYHSFNSLENEAMTSLLQQMVNLASKHGRFCVKDVLYGRKTISASCTDKAKDIKENLKIELREPQKADSLAITVDL